MGDAYKDFFNIQSLLTKIILLCMTYVAFDPDLTQGQERHGLVGARLYMNISYNVD